MSSKPTTNGQGTEAPPASGGGFWKRLAASRLFWPLLALFALLVFDFFFTTNFFTFSIRDGKLYGNLVDILRNGAPGILLAIGMTLVLATGGVDLSVGSVMAITGTFAAILATQTPLPFWTVILLTLGVGVLAGLWNGMLVAYVGMQPIVATLILMVAGRGIGKLLSEGQMVPFADCAPYVYLANGFKFYLPIPIYIVLFVLVFTSLMTRRTAIGLFIESVGNNETASRFCGINAPVVKLLIYGFCGMCAGIAGLLAASNTMQADPSRVGLTLELDAIFAVIVGGTALTGGRFTLAGSVVGAILLQTLTATMYFRGVAPDVAPVPKALVIVGVCLLQSPQFRRHFRFLSRGKSA